MTDTPGGKSATRARRQTCLRIGAGITGLVAARLLKDAGHDVTVIPRCWYVSVRSAATTHEP